MKKRKFRTLSLFLAFSLLSLSAVSLSPAALSTRESASPTLALSEEFRVSSRFLELLRKDARTREKTLTLIPGGELFGIKIRQCDISIAEVQDKDSPLAAGDILLSIDGVAVTKASDIAELLSETGETVRLGIRRDGKEREITVTPKKENGVAHLGITVRDAAAGIGTVTYYDPQSDAFGGLGHGICDPETGELIAMREGVVTEVLLGGAERGESGRPGELRGVLKREAIGKLTANGETGVLGTLRAPLGEKKDAVPVAHKEEVHEGDATLLSTVTGDKVASYRIRLHEIQTGESATKSFRITVTDESLIAMTGGIVRGMSGSPILQDGKLIGALTHVMVADPTEGYGIFIENMLNSANTPMAKAS